MAVADPTTATTVAVVTIGRPTFDLAFGVETAAAARRLLGRLGVVVVADPHVATTVGELDRVADELDGVGATIDAVVVLQATFADATMIVELAEHSAAPIICWSFPEARTGRALRMNSLCGANLAAYSLRRRGHHGVFVYVDPADPAAQDLVVAAIDRARHSGARIRHPDRARTGTSPDAAVEAARRVAAVVRGSTIGVIGEQPVGFEPCDHDARAVAELTGARCDPIELDRLFDAADGVGRRELRSIEDRVHTSLGPIEQLRNTGLEQSLRLYGGLRALSGERRWNALSTRCWPECMERYGGAVCAPQAMLTADGTPAVCEADVYGSLTALILHELAGRDPFIADLVDADRTDGTSVFWHCGAASLGLSDPDEPPRAAVHPNRQRALAHEFALQPGRVTIARLSQLADGPAMVIGGGEMLRRSRPFSSTCGVLRWDEPIDDVLDTIFGFGIEHHYGIVHGDHQDALAALADLWEIPVVALGRREAHAV